MRLAKAHPVDRPTYGIPIALWTLAVIASLFFLRSAATLLIPIVIGVLLSYAFEPVVAWMARHRVPRLAGASLILVLILGASTWGVYALREEMAAAVEALPQLAQRARSLMESSSNSGAAASIKQAADVLQGDDDALVSDSGNASSPRPSNTTGGPTALGADSRTGQRAAETSAEAAGPSPQPLPEAAGESGDAAPAGMLGMAQTAVGSLFAFAGHLAVILFLLFFLLLSGHHVRDRIVEISGDRDHRRLAARIMDDINAQIQRFLLVRLVTAGVVGLATWGVLAWMGVQNAAVWGILAGVFNSIPYFGPVIVSGGLLAVGLVQGTGVVQALQMSGAALVITALEGWFLTPPLMGKAERMSVLVVFLGLLLWTWIWGAWGTILAVPMLVVLKSVADHVERLKPLGRLMAP